MPAGRSFPSGRTPGAPGGTPHRTRALTGSAPGGLPALPVVTWPEPSGHEREDRWLGLCWKTRALVDWARGRPFAWVDDEITDADRDWVPANHRGRALLYHVEPFRGLTGKDFTALDRWLRAA